MSEKPDRIQTTESSLLTAADGFNVPSAGGDGDGPSLSQELNLTLYAENERLVAGSSCFSHGRVAVTYGGVAGVRLPEGQRRRLEAELRWGARTSTWKLSCSVTVTRRRGAPSCCGAKLPGLNCRHNRCDVKLSLTLQSCLVPRLNFRPYHIKKS